MPFLKRSKQKKRRKSFYTDDVVRDFSIGHSQCQLYFPQPHINLDEFGAIKDVCLSGDLEMTSTKECTIHLCAIPHVSENAPFTLDSTGQSSEV